MKTLQLQKYNSGYFKKLLEVVSRGHFSYHKEPLLVAYQAKLFKFSSRPSILYIKVEDGVVLASLVLYLRSTPFIFSSQINELWVETL